MERLPATGCQSPLQSLEQDVKFDAQDHGYSQISLSETLCQLTTDAADVKVTTDTETKALANTQQDCEWSARTVVLEKTGGAASIEYGLSQHHSFSYLVLCSQCEHGSPNSRLSGRGEEGGCAKSERSFALLQLASRGTSATDAVICFDTWTK